MRRLTHLFTFAAVAMALAAFRCPGPDPQGDGDGPAGGGGAGGGLAGGPVGGGEGGEGGGVDCEGRPNVDNDGDGYFEDDCNDCDPRINPDAPELATARGSEPEDENCDGEIDEAPVSCEPGNVAGLPAGTVAANAMEICGTPNGEWGLKAADFVRFDGTSFAANLPQNRARVLSGFGMYNLPTQNQKMFVMSSGRADTNNPGCGISCGEDNGLPVSAPTDLDVAAGCPPSGQVFDDIALEVELIPPPNAGGFKFNTAYFTHERPVSVCWPSRDHFLATLTAQGTSSNVVYDFDNVSPSADFAYFDHCSEGTLVDWCYLSNEMSQSCGIPIPSPYCDAGPMLLAGTGFQPTDNFEPYPGGSATGWLETVVPLENDEKIEIRFAIFDTMDSAHDSTVLLDGFAWTGPVDDDKPVTVVVESDLADP